MILKRLYSKSKTSQGLATLFSHSAVRNMGMGLLGMFLPIFLFEKLGYSMENLLWFYLISYFLFFLLNALGAIIMTRITLKRSMIWAIAFLIVEYLALYFLAQHDSWDKVIRLVGLSIMAATFFRCLFWVPYHTDFSKFTSRDNRGKQLGFMRSVSYIISFVVPMLSGFIVSRFGFGNLFVLSLIIVASSAIPLFLLPRVKERFEFSYLQTLVELFRKKNRKMLLAYGADGMQNMAGMVIWPVFIYQALDGKYLSIGLISSFIVIISVVLQLATGNYTDKISKRKLMRMGSVLYALGWIGKALVSTAFQIFVAGTYHSFSAIIMRTPFDTLFYEQAADSGHYIDEYSVLREGAINLGRVLMLGLLIALFALTPLGFGAAFLIAAVFSLLVNFI